MTSNEASNIALYEYIANKTQYFTCIVTYNSEEFIHNYNNGVLERIIPCKEIYDMLI